MLPDVISERNVLGGICEHVCVYLYVCVSVSVLSVCVGMSEWVAEAGFFLLFISLL